MIGTFNDGIFSDVTFTVVIGTFSDGMFSDGTLSDWDF